MNNFLKELVNIVQKFIQIQNHIPVYVKKFYEPTT